MDRRTAYLRSHIRYDVPLLQELERSCSVRDDVQPMVEPEVGALLAYLVRSSGASEVLELGTGIGYSALWFAGALREHGGRITTIDRDPRIGAEARWNFRQSGFGDCITLIEGDIEQTLKDLRGQSRLFDLIFQDGGKHLYPAVYEDVYALLAPGGILVSDDVLFPVESGIRQGLKRPVDAYNSRLLADRRYESVMLPAGHGVTVSWKRRI